MHYNRALKLLLMTGIFISYTHNLFAQTKYGEGGGVGGVSGDGVMVGGMGGGVLIYGGQGGGMESAGNNPTVQGNGGQGSAGDFGPGGAGGTIGGTIDNTGDPLPPFNSNNGVQGDQGFEAGGGGGGALAIINASDYTVVTGQVRGGFGGGGSDGQAPTNHKTRGGGGGGIVFILNGTNFKIEATAMVYGGFGGGKGIPDSNPLRDEFGGGGGLGAILNSGTLEIAGQLIGGDGGMPVTAKDYTGGRVPEGSPGGGLYMKANTTVNVLKGGALGTGTVQTVAQKAPPAVFMVGNNSAINNQGEIFRGFVSGLNADAESVPAIYILGDHNKVINGGLIFGNGTFKTSTTTSTAQAIEIEGNQNTIELWGGQEMDGLVQVTSGTENHLILGGDIAGTFKLNHLGQIDEGDAHNQQSGYLGFADFLKNGTSVWTVSGASAATEPWTIDKGTMALIDDASLASHSSVTLNASLDISGITDTTAITNLSGSAVSTIALGSKTLALTNTTSQTFAGVASGSGNIKVDQGTEIFTGDNTYTGLTSIASGATLQLGNDGLTGIIIGDAAVDGTLIFKRSDDLTYSAAISGTGSMQKLGAGVLTLSGDSSAFTGATLLDSGGLFVGGKLGSTLTAKSGTSLAGTGSVMGNATLNNGATLIGQQGHTLTFGSDLSLLSTTTVNVALGKAPNANSLFDVHGDLTLNGVLNITNQGDFGPGLYRLFSYGGNISGAGLTLGNVPTGSDKSLMEFQNPSNQYNLYFSGTPGFNMWDGGDASNHNNNRVDGGSGTWDANNDNWTMLGGATNAPWSQGEYAQFGGTSGTVTVDSTSTALNAQGLVFSTGGYVLTGGELTLEGDKDPTIRVGDGSASGAAMTATIESKLLGTQGMTKIDFGTLILAGDNTYSGGTIVNGGILQIGDGHSSGSIIGNVVVNSDSYGHGTLVFDREDQTTFSGDISGGGVVVQSGTGTTIFEGNNTFSGGLSVENGTAQAGSADNAFGSGRLSVNAGTTADLAGFNTTVAGIVDGKNGGGAIALGSGILTLNQNFDSNFTGVISGTGGLTKNSSGTLTLSGANNYSGSTAVDGGTLRQGAHGGFSNASSYSVAMAATLAINGFDTAMASLTNSGTVLFGGAAGTALNVTGDYAGNSGTIVMNTVLSGDDSKTDVMNVGGNTSGATTIMLINQGGLGGQTDEGIKIINVTGQSDGTFSLIGPKTKDGRQSVIAGAYTYTLHKNGISTPTDGDWYLRSILEDDQPHYNPGTPVYEGYSNTLQALNILPTMQQRVGNRYWSSSESPLVDSAVGAPGSSAGPGSIYNRGIWGRIEGAHNRLEANRSTTGMKQDINTFIMQAGVDGQFLENQAGSLIGGFTAQYGKAKSDITANHGDGYIDTRGWGLGGTMTWYGNNGFYLDTQAQVMWYDTTLNSATANETLTDSNKGFGYALSAEVGKRIDLDAHWSLTPQAQLTWSTVMFDTFSDAWGASVSSDDDDGLNARLGIAAHYSNVWSSSNGQITRTDFYTIANLYQELVRDNKVNVAGVGFENASDKTWGGVGAGGTYTWADEKYSLYGEGSIDTTLNNFAESYRVSGTIGLKVRW